MTIDSTVTEALESMSGRKPSVCDVTPSVAARIEQRQAAREQARRIAREASMRRHPSNFSR